MGARQLTQNLRERPALAENLGSNIKTYMVGHNHPNSGSKGSGAHFWSLLAMGTHSALTGKQTLIHVK